MKENHTKTSTRKQKIIMSSIGVITAICIVAFVIGNTTYSKGGQFEHFLELLEEGDATQVAEGLATNDPSFEITAESIQPYLQYIEENPTYLNDLNTSLARDGEKDNLTMVQNGKTMFFFDNYDFVLEPVYIELHTNQKDTAFFIDGEEVQVSDKDDYSVTVGPYAPGEFEITAAATLNGFEFTNSDTINLVREYEGTPPSIDLPLHGQEFKVSSALAGWQVVVGGNPVGTLDENGDGKFGPILWEEGLDVHAEKAFPSGTLATEPQSYGETDDLFVMVYEEPMNLRMTSLLLFDLYFNIINHFHNADDIEDRAYSELAEMLVGGAENPLYTQIADLVRQNKADTDAYDIRFTHALPDMTRTDIDTYEVDMEITERRNYPRRSSKESTRTVHPRVATIKVIETDEEGVPTKLQLESIEVVD